MLKNPVLVGATFVGPIEIERHALTALLRQPLAFCFCEILELLFRH
jgi:hypothetical protein